MAKDELIKYMRVVMRKFTINKQQQMNISAARKKQLSYAMKIIYLLGVAIDVIAVIVFVTGIPSMMNLAKDNIELIFYIILLAMVAISIDGIGYTLKSFVKRKYVCAKRELLIMHEDFFEYQRQSMYTGCTFEEWNIKFSSIQRIELDNTRCVIRVYAPFTYTVWIDNQQKNKFITRIYTEDDKSYIEIPIYFTDFSIFLNTLKNRADNFKQIKCSMEIPFNSEVSP